jgi:hypothetical protein
MSSQNFLLLSRQSCFILIKVKYDIVYRPYAVEREDDSAGRARLLVTLPSLGFISSAMGYYPCYVATNTALI